MANHVDTGAFWDSVYSSDNEFFGENESVLARRSLSLLNENNCKTILELGCGQGRDTVFFARNGFNIRAFDCSGKAISQLNEAIQNWGLDKRVQAMQADLSRAELLQIREGTNVDAVFSHLFLCMPFDDIQLRNLFDLAYDILNPHGLHIFSIRDKKRDKMYGTGTKVAKDTFMINGFSVRFFAEDEILNFNNKFDLIKLEQAEEEPCSLSCIFSIKKSAMNIK
jgi:cyclopropane fatty-acyl-phospholipid synthase-like methyltransferase